MISLKLLTETINARAMMAVLLTMFFNSFSITNFLHVKEHNMRIVPQRGLESVESRKSVEALVVFTVLL